MPGLLLKLRRRAAARASGASAAPPTVAEQALAVAAVLLPLVGTLVAFWIVGGRTHG